MAGFYGEDLAHIHDVGFSGYALGAAPGILEILARNGTREDLVVDLGCGSGLWTEQVAKAGYRALGIDVSEQMIAIARERVPEAEFRVGSLFDADIPPCHAVTAVGEVLNYLADQKNDERGLPAVFRRVHEALAPGGVFVFDVAEPGQAPPGPPTRGFTEGEGWVVLLEKEEDEDAGQRLLTRRIVTFRRTAGCYRREEEVHPLRLLESAEVAEQLRRAGFGVRTARAYGGYRLPAAHAAFVARKPP